MSNLDGIEWGSYDPQVAQKTVADSKQRGQFIKLEPGRNIIRIFPPARGQNDPFIGVVVHYIKLDGMERGQSFNCPKAMTRGASQCPFCDRYEELYNSGSPANQALAKQIKPRKQAYAVVVKQLTPGDAAQSATWSEPGIMRFPDQVHGSIAAYRDPQIGCDFTHPFEGREIIVDRTGTTAMDTKYQVYIDQRTTELVNIEWLRDPPKLGGLATVKTSEEIFETLMDLKASPHALDPYRGFQSHVVAGRAAAGALPPPPPPEAPTQGTPVVGFPTATKAPGDHVR